MFTPKGLNVKQVLCNLNGSNVRINVANMSDTATVTGPVVLCGSDTAVLAKNGKLVYNLSDPSTGWFCRINADDEQRLTAILRNPKADCGEFVRFAVVVTPLETVTAKQVASFTPAFNGGVK